MNITDRLVEKAKFAKLLDEQFKCELNLTYAVGFKSFKEDFEKESTHPLMVGFRSSNQLN